MVDTCSRMGKRRRRCPAAALAVGTLCCLLLAASPTTAASNSAPVLRGASSARHRLKAASPSDSKKGTKTSATTTSATTAVDGANRLFDEAVVPDTRKEATKAAEKAAKKAAADGDKADRLEGGMPLKNKQKCRVPKAGKLPPNKEKQPAPKEPLKGPGAVGAAPGSVAGAAGGSLPAVGIVPPGELGSAASIARAVDPITGEPIETVTGVFDPAAESTSEAENEPPATAETVAMPPVASGVESTAEDEEEFDNICDEDGNLLPGLESFAPTITPAAGTPVDIVDTWVDRDGDGLSDEQEAHLGTDPLNPDTDGDGMSDRDEIMAGRNPLVSDELDQIDGADLDGDGLADEDEIAIGTDVANPDSDFDGLNDGAEVALGTDPLDPDTDGDRLSDGKEVDIGTDPLKQDTDGDGLSDFNETEIHGTNPLKQDSDGDGLSDADEIANGLNPLVSDTAIADPTAVSPGCDAYEAGEVYKTEIPASVNFVYEMVIDKSADVAAVSDSMEISMARQVGDDLINCMIGRRGLKASGIDISFGHDHNRQLHGRHLAVDGVDPSPEDIVTETTCSYYSLDNPDTPTDSSCYVVQGLMTLYLRENTPSSSALVSSTRALRSLMTSMNQEDPSPFVDDSGNDELGVSGVKAVRYIKGTPDDGVVLIDNSGNPDFDSGADGAKTGEGNESIYISPVGIGLIAAGCVGILAVAFVTARTVRKRKRSPEVSPYAEFFDDFDNDLDMKHHGYGADGMTDVDATSLHGTPSPKKAKMYNYDDDTIFSGLETPGNNTTDPSFVHTQYDAASTAMTAEKGYEIGYAGDDATTVAPPPPPFEESYRGRNELPRYVPKEGVEVPRYERPSAISQSPERNRGFYVGDTVEF